MIGGAALAGFAAGVVLGPLPDPGLAFSAAAFAAALLLDVVARRFGRPRPWTLGTQVPIEWSRWFDPRVTALLYGGRLGIAPLTILGTWVWWVLLALSGARGPVEATLVGVTFGATRTATTIAAGMSPDHAGFFGALRTHPRVREVTLAAPTLGLAALLLLATSCGSGNELGVDGDPPPATTTSIDESATTGRVTTGPTTTTRAATTPPTTDQETAAVNDLDDTASSATTTPGDALAADLSDDLVADLSDVAGFAPIADPAADTYLDLAAAVARQPDPADEEALLLTRGFVGGWTRAFRNEHRDVAVLSVYEFGDAVQADFYLQDGLIVVGGYGGELFEIAELDGVHGFRQDAGTADEPLVTWGVTFTEGPRWYLAFVTGDAETVSAETVVAIAGRQLTNLEG